MSDRFVIDNSIVMTWCFIDEANQYADAVLEHLSAAMSVKSRSSTSTAKDKSSLRWSALWRVCKRMTRRRSS